VRWWGIPVVVRLAAAETDDKRPEVQRVVPPSFLLLGFLVARFGEAFVVGG